MIDVLCIALGVAGFAMLAGTMNRHQRDLIDRRLAPVANRRLRIAGFAVLAAALLVGMISTGAALGAIAWFGHLTVGAAIVLAWLLFAKSRQARR